MNEHEHHHEHDAPEARDSGSQALAEALHSSFAIVKFAMALMVIGFFCSGFFAVGPSEKAIILRFGKPVGEGQKALLGSGWHWAWPYPIDEVVRIPITEQQSVQSSVGWYFTTPEQELSGEEIPAGASLNPAMDGYAITADRNIIHTRATVYFHVENPIDYVFNFASASNALQNALNNSLLYTAAHFKVDDALYNDVSGFQEAVFVRASDLVERQKLGVVIDNCTVQNIPPRQLKDVFALVIQSRENLNKTITEAKTAANKIVNDAGAQAAAVVYQAQSSRQNYIATLNAEAKRFSDLLPQFQTNSALFAQQLLLPALADTLTNVGDKWFLPERADGKTREVRLMLNREPPVPKAQTAQ